MVAIMPSTRSVSYAPVASAGPFPIPFPLFDDSGADLFVTIDGEPASDWTFAGSPENGFCGAPGTWVDCTITFASPISGDLTIRGVRAPRRQNQFQEGQGIRARDFNAAFNILTAVDQELRRDIDAVDARALSLEAATALQNAATASATAIATAAAANASASAEAALNAPAVVQVATAMLSYQTRALAAAATIEAGVNYIQVLGYSAAGDGGRAIYRKVASDPGTPGAAFQSADGQWWGLVPGTHVNAKVFGAAFNGVADDTTALQNLFNYVAARRLVGILPQGVALIGTIFLPSYLDLRGTGAGTILKVKNAHDATALLNSNYSTSLASGGGNTDIRLSDFWIDSNGDAQNVGMYPLALVNVQNVELRRLRLFNPTGTLLYLSENDVFGSGPGGHPAIPGAQQFNYNVTIEDCVFDGSAQRYSFNNADLNVVCRVQGLWMRRNTFIGGGANCISLQMNREFHFCENVVRNFFRGVFVESCSFGEISRNDLFQLGTIAWAIGDDTYCGIWLCSANESYPGAGYNASSDILVHGNHIHDLTRGGGATGLIGIRVSGPYGSVGAFRNTISDNIISRFAASGSQERAGIVLEGWCEDCVVKGNVVTGQSDSAEHGIVMGRGGYGGADDIRNCAALNNRVSQCFVGIWQQNVGGHLGTMIVGNHLRGCTNPTAIANPSQVGYLLANNAV